MQSYIFFVMYYNDEQFFYYITTRTNVNIMVIVGYVSYVS